MRFGDFLRTTVLASASGASALMVATLAGVNATGDDGVVWIALVWWLLAGGFGLWQGRVGASSSDSIRSLLAAARTQAGLPELTPRRTLLNRLWPLITVTVAAAAVSLLVPQVPAVVGGFLIIWAFTWRRQPAAVRAIEDRDGARFYIARTRAWEPIRLIRTPGFRTTMVEMNGAARPSTPGGV